MTTNRDWLPEAHYMPLNGGYVGLYRWNSSRPWVQLKGRVVYRTSKQAEDAAKDYLRAALNDQVRADAPEPLPDIGQASFRSEKAKEAEDERARVFGHMESVMGFAGHGRQFVIERRRRA